MSERASKPTTPAEPATVRKRSRLRRFFLRHLPLSMVCGAVLLALAAVCLYFWASSAEFEGLVRKRLVAYLEQSTGGRVEIASFHWHLLDLEAEAGGLVIHGREAQGEAPYAQAEGLRARVSVLGLWSPRVLLNDLEVSRPAFHLIVYPDGSTNQPQPRRPSKPGKFALDAFFDLQAGHVSVQQGILHYDNRVAAFDFQNRFIPLDFEANDVSLLLIYMPGDGLNPESYRVEAGAADLNLARGRAQPVQGRFQATLDLTRHSAHLPRRPIRRKIMLWRLLARWTILPTRTGKPRPRAFLI